MDNKEITVKYREWYLANHASEGFCQVCGGTSQTKRFDPDDIHVIEYSAVKELAKEAREALLMCFNSVDKRSPAGVQVIKTLAKLNEFLGIK